MIDHALIDNLNLGARDFALRWKNMVRKAQQLKHYNNMDDNTLIEIHHSIYPILARTLDRGLDRSLVGNYFVNVGKERMQAGFPVSEVIYALSLTQKVVIEYIMTEYAPENSMRMYQSMGALTQVAEFCLLGSFYISRGFLEETYTSMSSHDKISEELLKKYLRDDFFFKKD